MFRADGVKRFALVAVVWTPCYIPGIGSLNQDLHIFLLYNNMTGLCVLEKKFGFYISIKFN